MHADQLVPWPTATGIGEAAVPGASIKHHARSWSSSVPTVTSSMMKRYLSCGRRLDVGFLNAPLAGTRSYDRIAGHFSASILEDHV